MNVQTSLSDLLQFLLIDRTPFAMNQKGAQTEPIQDQESRLQNGCNIQRRAKKKRRQEAKRGDGKRISQADKVVDAEKAACGQQQRDEKLEKEQR